MTDLTVLRTDLPDLSVAEVAALPPQRLQELDLALADLLAWAKQAKAKLDAALEQRYGEQARTSLRVSGRDFGVTHVSDGALRITYELPKRVAWDQKQLTAIAERVACTGERVEDYMDIELSVPESRWSAWPPVLKEQFASARTVKPGKPSFRLALGDEGTP